ncbi:hypothetical protein CB0940_10921 [Cercospora beticola]|uniref:Protein-S-isoprenylcysteine O-methyltransferase n=1 Tax=Cercospora beticola TaxID=122368 RepID=A0A2G5HDZ4_CERBT|nr:hypothetical protein CB0940_10921 [Cercospora beticola]PIA90771.1 hypothetical protein CB0940_10921 [Cercospora beticola]WPB07738.1 hypothetical protein RHO25_012401 [Cercospora beticola]
MSAKDYLAKQQAQAQSAFQETANTAKISLLSPLNILFLLTTATQLYAYLFHFRHPPSGTRSPGYIHFFKILSIISAFATFWPTFIRGEAVRSLGGIGILFAIVATGLFTSSLTLFAWTAYTTSPPGRLSVIFGKASPEFVITTGPYQYIRHPTYVSYATTWIGCIFMLLSRGHFGDAWFYVSMVSLAGLSWLYREAAEQEEAEFRVKATREEVRDKYQEYSTRVEERWFPGMAQVI